LLSAAAAPAETRCADEINAANAACCAACSCARGFSSHACDYLLSVQPLSMAPTQQAQQAQQALSMAPPPPLAFA